MTTAAQQMSALQDAQLQARYDGAMAYIEQVFADGLGQVHAYYPRAGDGKGTRAQAEQLEAMAAALQAVLMGMTFIPRRRWNDAPYADFGQGREVG